MMQISERRAFLWEEATKVNGLHEGLLIHSRTSRRPMWAGHGKGHAAGAEVREVPGFQIMLGCQATARTLAFALSRR